MAAFGERATAPGAGGERPLCHRCHIESAAARVADGGHLDDCNGCEAAIACDPGARLAISGAVREVSTLILQIAVTVRLPLRVPEHAAPVVAESSVVKVGLVSSP